MKLRKYTIILVVVVAGAVLARSALSEINQSQHLAPRHSLKVNKHRAGGYIVGERFIREHKPGCSNIEIADLESSRGSKQDVVVFVDGDIININDHGRCR